MMIIKPDWPLLTNIHAFCTTRQSGFSLLPYAHFNLGTHVGEAVETTQLNREKLSRDYHLPSTPCWLKQIHSTRVINLIAYHENIEADASFTHQKNRVCAILTADCLPLLITDVAGTVVAAIHAGWRGLSAGIIDSTIETLQVPTHQLYVWLGPAISQAYYEVDTTVYDAFQKNGFDVKSHFKQIPVQAEEKWLVDLYGLAKDNLSRLGITRIYGGEYCTYQQSDLFYSHRRDKVTGRFASFIWIS